MSDLDVVALIKAKPGSEQIVSDALSALVAPTQAEEGCISYTLHVSAADPTTFVTIERWRSQDDLDAHMKTPHIAETFKVAGDHLAEPPSIHPLAPVAS